MTSPLYSMITSPLGMPATANTPLPRTRERLTWMRRPVAGAAGAAFGAVFDLGVLAAFACVIDFFGYIELVGARACVHARDARIVLMLGGSPREAPEKTYEQDTDHCGKALG